MTEIGHGRRCRYCDVTAGGGGGCRGPREDTAPGESSPRGVHPSHGRHTSRDTAVTRPASRHGSQHSGQQQHGTSGASRTVNPAGRPPTKGGLDRSFRSRWLVWNKFILGKGVRIFHSYHTIHEFYAGFRRPGEMDGK